MSWERGLTDGDAHSVSTGARYVTQEVCLSQEKQEKECMKDEQPVIEDFLSPITGCRNLLPKPAVIITMSNSESHEYSISSRTRKPCGVMKLAVPVLDPEGTLPCRVSSGEYASLYQGSRENIPCHVATSKLGETVASSLDDDVNFDSLRDEVERLQSALHEQEVRNGELEREVERLQALCKVNECSAMTVNPEFPKPRVFNFHDDPSHSLSSDARVERMVANELVDTARLRTHAGMVHEFFTLTDHVLDVLREAKDNFLRRRKLVKSLLKTVACVRNNVQLQLADAENPNSTPTRSQIDSSYC